MAADPAVPTVITNLTDMAQVAKLLATWASSLERATARSEGLESPAF